MSADILAILGRATLALSAAIVLVFLLRRPMRAAFGAEIAYAFWLLAPIATLASFLPARTILFDPAPTGAPAVEAAAPAMTSAFAAIAPTAVYADVVTPALVALWAIGAIFGLLLVFTGQRRFLSNAAQAGPAVVGILRPRIVLPADFTERYTPLERDLVVAHERSHLAAWDAQINALAALVQCLMWFNPLVHAARAALRVDQELACDARVLAGRTHQRRAYAEAMLKTQLAAQAVPLGCQWPPLGVRPLKQRIAMLAAPSSQPARRAAGAAFCLLAACATGVATWALQPPRVAYAQDQTAQRGDARLGRLLVTALQDGDMQEARALVERGADVNTFLPGDGTPLVAASRSGDTAFARFLIENGADVNRAAPGDGNPLIMAAAFGHVDLATLLVEAGADVNGIVRGDETPLINAARGNQLEIARYLIARGADVNLAVDAPTLRGIERRSPLSEARRRNHTEMIALLRASGARS